MSAPRMSTSSSSALSASAPASAAKRTARAWPWRKHITPPELILNHPYAGKGTIDAPYIVDWLPEVQQQQQSEGSSSLDKDELEPDISYRVVDVEYPQTWQAGYKWMITAIGAISVLSVTMTSSMMSAAIYEIRREFPGHTAEMYIMSESRCVSRPSVLYLPPPEPPVLEVPALQPFLSKLTTSRYHSLGL